MPQGIGYGPGSRPARVIQPQGNNGLSKLLGIGQIATGNPLGIASGVAGLSGNQGAQGITGIMQLLSSLFGGPKTPGLPDLPDPISPSQPGPSFRTGADIL